MGDSLASISYTCNKSSEFQTNNNSRAFVNINISGQTFKVKKDIAARYPNSKLGKLVASGKPNPHSPNPPDDGLYDYYDHVKQEYFFQRDPTCFPTIIGYYTNGCLHLPRHLCVELFQTEVTYWGIPFGLDTCCQAHHQQEWELAENVRKTNEIFEQKKKCKKVSLEGPTNSIIELTPESAFKRYKRKTWDVFEKADTSKMASIVAVVSSLMVIISTITLCVSTLPEYKEKLPDGTIHENIVLKIIEIVCIFWFTIEYLVRIVSCPNKREFLKSILNGIDLLAILPFYVALIIESMEGNVHDKFTDLRRFVQVLRIFRIVRIFKVARHSTGLQVLGYTVRNSGSELGLLFMLLIMGMTLFSCLVYYAEENVPGTKFKSIISAFWWAIITMTTVGYGDIVPTSTVGKLIGSMCCISGILFIALPIPTIVSNFSAFYKDHRIKEKFNKMYEGQDEDEMLRMLSHASLMAETSGNQTSAYNLRGLEVRNMVSVAQIERAEIYHRRLSSIIGVQNFHLPATGNNKVHPTGVIKEDS